MPTGYNFTSPGAGATDALTAFLAQQAEQRNRELLTQVAQQNARTQEQRELSAAADREVQRRLQGEQIDSLVDQREAARVKALIEGLVPEYEIPAEQYALVQKHGYGGYFQDEPEQPGRPRRIRAIKGGPDWQEQRQRAQEKQDLEARKAAEESKKVATQVALAKNQIVAQTVEIENELNKMLVMDEQGGTHLAPGAAAIYGDLRLGALTGIPGVNAMTGAADAKASRDRVVGQLMVNLITEMKNASKTGATGFGQLSEREGQILRDAASKLSNPAISEAAVKTEILRLRESAARIRTFIETGKYEMPALEGPASQAGGAASAAVAGPAAPSAAMTPPASTAPATPPPGHVLVRTPDGRVGYAPADQVRKEPPLQPASVPGAAMAPEPAPAPVPATPARPSRLPGLLEGRPVAPGGTMPTPSADAGMMISPQGLADLQKREGFVPTAAPDVNGLAIGFGQHTIGGQPVQAGQTITRPAAETDMVQQIRTTYAPAILRVLRVPVSQGQLDALISVAYNAGPAVAQRLVAKLNRGETLVESDFLSSATVQGQPHRGLSARRRQEAAPFLVERK